MKTCKNKIGVTLTEMLVVVAVIVVLASLVITAATRIRNQSQEQLAENTIATLTAALQQFADYGYRYNNSDYSDFDFPLDCNGLSQDALEEMLETELGLAPGSVVITNHNKPLHLEYSGCEALYFLLSRVPECRKTLDKIDRSREWVDEYNVRHTLTTNLNDDGDEIEIWIGGKPYYPLLRVIDPWGTTLHYDYYDENSKRTFPVITSAGPDKIFGTSDDIRNR